MGCCCCCCFPIVASNLYTAAPLQVPFLFQLHLDECPICLEQYDIDNPKLLTKCGHNFHLACIREWMERSEACPVCDKILSLTRWLESEQVLPKEQGLAVRLSEPVSNKETCLATSPTGVTSAWSAASSAFVQTISSSATYESSNC
ncbi:hypothetical protein F2Q68_00026683 [Brassica cretica]|uniref:RING-type E3 ubiquitin transferase n=1 Tax=Brassica cretica TaxID=69181 RepID=A0A8S9I9N2_BRACR|nr:hypothetical protein F2Q68_00026683 [Brassica cretica]